MSDFGVSPHVILRRLLTAGRTKQAFDAPHGGVARV